MDLCNPLLGAIALRVDDDAQMLRLYLRRIVAVSAIMKAYDVRTIFSEIVDAVAIQMKFESHIFNPSFS